MRHAAHVWERGKKQIMARIAKSLAALRKQVNEAYPKRDKAHDGWIGDQAHASRASDHNPNKDGVVLALDLTHDPANGFNARTFAEVLRKNRDNRVSYVIDNGEIFSSTVSPWKRRPYRGSNKHDKHTHISVVSSPQRYDDARAWVIAPEPAWPIGGNRRNTKITCTVFDDEFGAYSNKPLDHTKFIASLPAPVPPGTRVRIFGPGGTAVADVEDKGPHYDGTETRPADRYWETGARPRAEKEKKNKSGIDVNPKLAEALGMKVTRDKDGKIIGGMCLVDWVLL
jgi:hypothetical protein